MLVKRRRARLLEIAQGNDADAELRKLASIGRRNAAQPPSLWLSETRSGFMPGGAPRGRLDSGTRLGNAALIPAGHLNYAPNLLNTLVCDQVIRPVMWRHSKMLRVRAAACKPVQRSRARPASACCTGLGICGRQADVGEAGSFLPW